MIRQLTSRPELIIVALMVVIIAMLVVPMPPVLIDMLIGFNIMIAVMIFIGSFYLKTILDFSSFPSILLITTVFRLALSITTSRMILLQADAGRIVESFGVFVVGGDLMVGVVIFLIVTIVQFIVITKGSERIAEVCARFSLDGLPGKQMSIDADVRAGTIDANEARRRRATLESESQLYGSLDGAMKFIKGDAIASIFIIFVNFIGGIAVGAGRHGMGLHEALETYSLLTVGDGLVAQVPALLISVGSGFVVTRVKSDESNLGRDILRQVTGQNPVLLIVAALSLLLATLPGFPSLVFIVMALGLVAFAVARSGGVKGLKKRMRASRGADSGVARDDKGAESGALAEDISKAIPETVPLALLVPPGQLEALTRENFAAQLQKEAYLQLGIRMAPPLVSERASLAANEVRLLVNEVAAETLGIAFGKWVLGAQVEQARALGLSLEAVHSAGSATSYWVDASQVDHLRRVGVPVRSAQQELTRRFISLAARSSQEYFGIQETKNLLDAMEAKYPELLKETYRNAPVQRIAQILQRLLAENVSIRNLKVVLEAIAQWAPKERDNILLTEHVRTALARYISERVSVDGRIHAFVLTPETEESVRQHVKQTASGAYLQMPVEDSDAILSALAGHIATTYQPPEWAVVLTSLDVRRFVKRLIEPRFPDLNVVSFGEIADQGRVNVINTL